MPEALPAPRATTISAPSALNFLTVSGVAATRGSLASVSRATAIRMTTPSRPQALSAAQHAVEEDQRAEHEGRVARGAAAAEQAGDEAEDGNDEHDHGREPMAGDAADRETQQNVHD